jgi:hypothetical protein
VSNSTKSDRCRGCPAAINQHTARKPAKVCVIGHTLHLRFVHAIDPMSRMHQARRKLAVVGQQQQSFGIEIESSHRINVLTRSGHKIQHRWTALRIETGGDKAPRLVQEKIDA